MVFTSVFPCELRRSRDLHPQHFNRKQLIAINILLSHFNSDYGEADQHGTEPKMGRYWPLALAHTTERALHNRGILGIHSPRPINIQEDIRFCVCHCQSLLFRNRPTQGEFFARISIAGLLARMGIGSAENHFRRSSRVL